MTDLDKLEALADGVLATTRGSDAQLKALFELADACSPAEVKLLVEKARTVDELAMLVRMLVQHVPETKKIRARAMDYLGRKGLSGSPFRARAAHTGEG